MANHFGKKILFFAAIFVLSAAAGNYIWKNYPEEHHKFQIILVIIMAVYLFVLVILKILKNCTHIRTLQKTKKGAPEFAEAVDMMTGETYTYLKNVSDHPLSENSRAEIISAYKKEERIRRSNIFRQILLILLQLVILAAIILLTAVAVGFINLYK